MLNPERPSLSLHFILHPLSHSQTRGNVIKDCFLWNYFIEAVWQAPVFGCDVIHCMQGSVLCLTAAVIIFQSDGAQCTYSSRLHLCAFTLIHTWPSATSAVTKKKRKRRKFLSCYLRDKFRRSSTFETWPLKKQFKTLKPFMGRFQIKNANFLMMPCFQLNFFSRCSLIFEMSKQGMEMNHMTSGKLLVASRDNYTLGMIISISEGKHEVSWTYETALQHYLAAHIGK